MTFNEYQQRSAAFASRTAKLTREFPLAMWTLGLAGETGELTEKVKKRFRDGTQNEAEILKEAGDVLWYLAQIVSACGATLDDVATGNLAKLESRAARGVLSGSGDNR